MVSHDGLTPTDVATVSGESGSYRVTGLIPGTWYSFQLVSNTDSSNTQVVSTANTEAVYDEPDNDPHGAYQFPTGSTLGSADYPYGIYYKTDNGTPSLSIPNVPPHSYTNVKVYFYGFGSCHGARKTGHFGAR